MSSKTYRKKNAVETIASEGDDYKALRTAQNTEFITISQKN